MNEAVHDTSKGEDTTNDCTHADKELEEVLTYVRVLDRERRHLVVEDDQALKVLIFRLARRCQLENLVLMEQFSAE